MLNVWAAGLLYQPVENHLVPAKVNDNDNDNDEMEENENNDEDVVEEEAEENNDDENNFGTTITVTSPDDDDNNRTKNHLIVTANNSINSNSKIKVNAATPFVPKSASSVALENYKNSPVQGRMRKISMPTPSAREISGQMHSTPALHVVPERTIRRRAPTKSPSSSSFHYVSTPYHGNLKKDIPFSYLSKENYYLSIKKNDTKLFINMFSIRSVFTPNKYFKFFTFQLFTYLVSKISFFLFCRNYNYFNFFSLAKRTLHFIYYNLILFL